MGLMKQRGYEFCAKVLEFYVYSARISAIPYKGRLIMIFHC